MRRGTKCVLWWALLALAWSAAAQTALDLKTQSKNVDFGNQEFTKPNKTGSALPATCRQGETFFLTTAEQGKNLHGCAAANQWKVLGDGGGAPPYALQFTGETLKTATAAEHGFITNRLASACYGSSGSRVEGYRLSVDAVTLAVTVEFPVGFQGVCVLQGSGPGGTGTGDGAPTGPAGGDLAGTYPDPVLAVSGVAAGVYGSGTQVPQITVDAKGRVTSAQQVAVSVSGEATSVSNSGTGAKVLKTGTNVAARTIVGGLNVSVAESTDEIRIDANVPSALVTVSAGLTGAGSEADPVRVNPATVPSYLTATATLSFLSFGDAGGCEDQSVSVPGAAAGDAVSVGLPDMPAGLTLSAAWAVADAAVVRLCRPGGTATVTELTFRVWVNRLF